MAEPLSWFAGAVCRTEVFKEEAFRAGAIRDPSQVFFPIEAYPDTGKPFPGDKKPKGMRAIEQRFQQVARRACGDCPSRRDCLLWTMMSEQEPWGIAGGLDPQARMDLLDNDKAKLIERECSCGVALHGTQSTLPERCSSFCKRKVSE